MLTGDDDDHNGEQKLLSVSSHPCLVSQCTALVPSDNKPTSELMSPNNINKPIERI